ncbi:MAG TPA: TraB/GumN family protein, partial [Polyangiales bacterium]|nr:TraB/GumN family protein [Polyangiales bacterium]
MTTPNDAQPEPEAAPYTEDVEIVRLADRDVLLVGTAHISAESVQLVHEVIERERPDCVCVELDERRYQALSEKNRWEGLDLREVIKHRQLATLLLNFLLSSYQKRLGGKLGVMPGSELLEATRTAEQLGIPVRLCDRDVRITLRRAWAALSFMDKSKLLATALAASMQEQTLSEEELRRIRQKDVLSELMNELGRVMPALKRVLIDERDGYLAQKIREAPGRKIVAVVGAGHVAGMRDTLQQGVAVDMAEVQRIPDVPLIWRLIGWGIPAAIVASIVAIGFTKGAAAAGNNALYWVLANSIPCAIASAIAFAHPITVLAALVAAPFTSLSPLIGAGHVTAFVQAYVLPPRVHEFSSVSEDIALPRNWWRSRLLRVLLVFILSSVGGLIGVWIGSVRILS